MDLLLTKYLKAAISYRGIQRVESLPVPEDALREAVLNAIIHKDYSVGAPIQIRVHEDRLRIWNPGELPERWSVEKLLGQHPSRPFNPSVANAFFRAGEIEAWGRGIQRIFDACRDAGAPEPRMLYETGDMWIEFQFPPAYLEIIPAVANRPRLDKRLDERLDEKLDERLDEKLDERLDEKLGAARVTIMRLMRDNPGITVSQIASGLQMSRTAADKNIQILKSQGYVKRIGPAKGGHWEVVA